MRVGALEKTGRGGRAPQTTEIQHRDDSNASKVQQAPIRREPPAGELNIYFVQLLFENLHTLSFITC